MIASLQEGGVGVSGSAHKASLEQLRLEKEAVLAELETARLQGEGLRVELQEADEQHSHEMTQLSEQVRGKVPLLSKYYIVVCRFRSWRRVWSLRRLSSSLRRRTCSEWSQSWRCRRSSGRGREARWLHCSRSGSLSGCTCGVTVFVLYRRKRQRLKNRRLRYDIECSSHTHIHTGTCGNSVAY